MHRTRWDKGCIGAAMRRRWGVVLSLAAVLLALSARAAEPPPISKVTLAGSFNNWHTSDETFTLAKVGSRYELVRAWSSGRYEFKFVFDGSWAHHWGTGAGG